MNRIVIVVEGGLVTNVYSWDEDIEITIIDVDNEKCAGLSSEEIDKKVEKEIYALHDCGL